MNPPQIREFDGETWLRAADVIAYLLEVADWCDAHIPGPGYAGLAFRTAAEKVSVTLDSAT